MRMKSEDHSRITLPNAACERLDNMSQAELDENWKRAEAQLRRLTEEEWARFEDDGGTMWGLIEQLVANGIDLKAWASSQEPRAF